MNVTLLPVQQGHERLRDQEPNDETREETERHKLEVVHSTRLGRYQPMVSTTLSCSMKPTDQEANTYLRNVLKFRPVPTEERFIGRSVG
jgi:hypothetical protein